MKENFSGKNKFNTSLHQIGHIGFLLPTEYFLELHSHLSHSTVKIALHPLSRLTSDVNKLWFVIL